MSDEIHPKITLSPRFAKYLETMLNRILIKSGWGTVTIRVQDGRIFSVECSVSERYQET